METIRGTADFLGLNYYTSRFVEMAEQPVGVNPSYDRDRGLVEIIKPEWKLSASDWLYSVPQGFGDILRLLFSLLLIFLKNLNLKFIIHTKDGSKRNIMIHKVCIKYSKIFSTITFCLC